MKKSGEIPTIFPKGTIVKFNGIPCELLQDTPYYSETFKVGDMVRIVDVGEMDSRHHLRDKMIGMVIKVLRIDHLDSEGWFGGIASRYPSQNLALYGKDFSENFTPTWTHAEIKIEEV